MADKSKAKTKKETDDLFEDGDDALIINMDEVEGQSFELIPKGTYDVVVEECEYKLSNASGKPMWSLTLVITDGEFQGRKLFHILSFSPKALPGSKAQIQRLAPELLSSSFNPKAIAESGQLVGKQGRVKTKIEAYEGEDRTRVANFIAAKPSDGFED